MGLQQPPVFPLESVKMNGRGYSLPCASCGPRTRVGCVRTRRMPARISTAATAASGAHHHVHQRKYSSEDAPAYPWQKLVTNEKQAQNRKLAEWKRRNSDLIRYSKPCKVTMALMMMMMLMMMKKKLLLLLLLLLYPPFCER